VIAGKSSTQIPNVQRERAFAVWNLGDEICLELGILDLGFRAWPMALKKFECET
jgi:hypothetical protein